LARCELRVCRARAFRRGGTHHEVIHLPREELDAPNALLLSVLSGRVEKQVAARHELQHVELDAAGLHPPHLPLRHAREA